MAYISIRIAKKSFTIFSMSPITATRILRLSVANPQDRKKDIRSMAKCISLAIVGSSSVFSWVKRAFVYRRIMRKATFEELFSAYQCVIKMIPIEDIAVVSSAFQQLSQAISKDK